jgi:hypothetical protein
MADMSRRNFMSMAGAAAGAFLEPLSVTAISVNWLETVDTKAMAEQIIAELKAEFVPHRPHVGPQITQTMPEGQPSPMWEPTWDVPHAVIYEPLNG